jgi:hypothetical protein
VNRPQYEEFVSEGPPLRLMPRIASPLANRSPGDTDFAFVRKNSDYPSVAGRFEKTRSRVSSCARSVNTGRRHRCLRRQQSALPSMSFLWALNAKGQPR